MRAARKAGTRTPSTSPSYRTFSYGGSTAPGTDPAPGRSVNTKPAGFVVRFVRVSRRASLRMATRATTASATVVRGVSGPNTTHHTGWRAATSRWMTMVQPDTVFTKRLFWVP